MSSNFLIRKMETGDIEEAYNLGLGKREFATASASFWTKDQLISWCESEQDIMLIAEKDGKIVGFSFYAAHIPTGKVTLENIYVDPAVRGLGIAKALVEEGLKKIKDLSYPYAMLCVNATDQEAFASFVEGYGFKRGDKVLWMDQIL